MKTIRKRRNLFALNVSNTGSLGPFPPLILSMLPPDEAMAQAVESSGSLAMSRFTSCERLSCVLDRNASSSNPLRFTTSQILNTPSHPTDLMLAHGVTFAVLCIPGGIVPEKMPGTPTNIGNLAPGLSTNIAACFPNFTGPETAPGGLIHGFSVSLGLASLDGAATTLDACQSRVYSALNLRDSTLWMKP